jgi:hypothetical protein
MSSFCTLFDSIVPEGKSSRIIELVLTFSQRPPYQTIGDQWSDRSGQRWRNLRKKEGNPASKEAGIFSHLIDDLRTQGEKYLGTNIQAVVATYPAMKGLYREEIYDGLGYSILRALELR